MKKIFLYINIMLLAAFVLSSCDEVTDYKQSTGNTQQDSTKHTKKILIEDFTGFKCGNCPKAHRMLDTLLSLYPSKLIPVAIHAGGFAEPDANHPYDFRTDAGTEYSTYFGITAYPSGLINRKEFNGSVIVDKDQWASSIASILNEEPKMTIDLKAYYSNSTQEISLDIDVEYLENCNNSHKLCVIALEDSIVQFQLDYTANPSAIKEYVHKHVLRTNISNIWGDVLSPSKTIAEGTSIQKKYSFFIPQDKGWRANKLRFVAYIVDTENHFEVLQAEETDKLIIVL